MIETIEPSVAEGRTTTSGAPSDRATPETVRGCAVPLNSSTARARFRSAFVGTAWTWRSRGARARLDARGRRRGGRDSAT